jgi:Uma2 family endonuclease
MKGCTEMNLAVYPTPDLAIESDVTSTATLAAYKALGIPEVWIYRNCRLTIYLLQNGKYIESLVSLVFTDVAIAELIPDWVQTQQFQIQNEFTSFQPIQSPQ